MRLLVLSTCPSCTKVEAFRSLVAAALVATIALMIDTGTWRPFAWVAGVYCLNVAISIGWHGLHKGVWS